MNKDKKSTYSYHTFLFPFIWNDNEDIEGENSFEKVLGNRWFETSWGREEISNSSSKAVWLSGCKIMQLFSILPSLPTMQFSIRKATTSSAALNTAIKRTCQI